MSKERGLEIEIYCKGDMSEIKYKESGVEKKI
jgi:hypothetical protein